MCFGSSGALSVTGVAVSVDAFTRRLRQVAIPPALSALAGVSAGPRGVYVVRVSGLERGGSTAAPFTREADSGRRRWSAGKV
jgi:hypothetical protein